eukprot:TRINITY_DN198_c0_g2_i2.p2 TRINITY_DN198_c0_g2~~TRINITY_DN198_c0_g2_i2.p2  ORF type:complete len:403 (+),score=93.50 TRINITY_DN198_c0_g2_i2:183-1211(+)
MAALTTAEDPTSAPIDLTGDGSVVSVIFAADHGMAAPKDAGGEECSAFPQVVTRSIVRGLEAGVAGASVLAKANGVQLRVVDVGVAGAGVAGGAVAPAKEKLPGGTKNACVEPAMSGAECAAMLAAGRAAVCEHAAAARLVVFGEVGIGNTTASSLLLAALLRATDEAAVVRLCGNGALSGRSADPAVIPRKAAIVMKALRTHAPLLQAADSPTEEVLAACGGAEIAALTGAVLEASARNIPVLVDGFIVTVAALAAVRMDPAVSRVLLFATASAERGHAAAVAAIQEAARAAGLPVPAPPALAMGLRLGEASAGLLAVPLARSAVAVLGQMGTIQDILSMG